MKPGVVPGEGGLKMVGGRLPRCWLDTWPTPATEAVSRRAELALHHQVSTQFVLPRSNSVGPGAGLMATVFPVCQLPFKTTGCASALFSGLAPASGGALITLLPPFFGTPSWLPC